MNRLFNEIKRCTRGEVKLWKVFWMLNIAPFIAFLIISIGSTHDVNISTQPTSRNILYTINVLATCYFAWVAFCIWRCSNNVNWRGWTTIVRLYEVIICWLYTSQILDVEIRAVKSLIGPSFYTTAVAIMLIFIIFQLSLSYFGGGIALILNRYWKCRGRAGVLMRSRALLPWLVAIIHLSLLSSTISASILLDHGYSDAQYFGMQMVWSKLFVALIK